MQSRGIGLYSPNYNIISNCNVYSNNHSGIYLSASDNNTVSDCNIYSNNNYGIRIVVSNDNIFSNCNIYSNNEDGFYIYLNVNNNKIFNCNISNNNYGIYIFHSCNNTFTENIIANNNYYGISTHPVNNNIFYHNNLINNTPNAYDAGNNIWDDGYPSGGNYWDDYNGVDNDGDGIGDTPYNIPGGDNRDRYPLMEPFVQYPEFDVSGRGGIGLKISITNVGDIAATNVEWRVSAKGGLFGLINLSEDGSLNSLDIGESISLTLMPFGFGSLKISIEIDASYAEKQIFKGRFFIILFIVFPMIPPLYWFR